MAKRIVTTCSETLWIGLLCVSSAVQAQAPHQVPTDSDMVSATGRDALSQTPDYQNTACGSGALYSNTTGLDNTAAGAQALSSNRTGSFNIAIGQGAGMQLTTGNFNIDIGNGGVIGESRTIRIGTPSSQTATFIAGIHDTPLSGNPVVIDANGQLGVVVSSERFKTDIRPISPMSDKLAQLRPVSFRLKAGGSASQPQYGLVAEEVAKVLPDLVISDDSGRADGVRYDELSALLLKELQVQQAQLTAQAEQLAALQDKFAELQNSRAPRSVSAIPHKY